MSKLNKRTSLLAFAVALALPGTALAVTAGYPTGGTLTYASNVVNSSTTQLDIAAGATFGITATDNLAGRTVGFGVRITLDGAQFDTTGIAPTVAVSTDQAGTSFDGGTVTTENVSSSVALFSVGVDTANTAGMKVGDVLDIGAFSIKSITKPSVTAVVEIYDPTTNAVLAKAPAYVLFNTKQAVVLTLDQAGSDFVNKKIDVVEDGTFAAKTALSPDGTLDNDAADAANALHFNAGELVLSVATFGNPVISNVLDETGAPLNYIAGDELTYTVTSTGNLEADAFSDIFLSYNADCSSNDYDGDVDGSVVEFANIPANTEQDVPLYLCFTVTGTDVIAAQSFTATGELDFITATYTDWSGNVSQDPLPLKYNGSVIQLFNVNPASNTTQESLLRYTNNSGRSYKVTLVGTDDAGVTSTGTVSFELPAHASIGLRSVEIENGSTAKGLTGSLGAPTSGKWVIEATAEGTGLVGSGLNRSATTGVISELNGEKHTDPADGTRVKTVP